jgi:FKBP12-rapamycin complex-associated protein
VKVKGSVLLPYVFPVLTSVLKSSNSQHLEFYFQSMSNIVSSVSLHIRPFVTEIVNLIHQFWGNSTSSLLNLIESLIGALKGECNDPLVTLIFPCVLLLKTEKDMGPKVVRVLSCFGPMLSNEIETLFQTYLDILQESSADMHLAILKSIFRLFLYADFSNYISILIKILLPSFKHHDPRIREASAELYSLLMKSYEFILRPYQPVLLKLISDGSLNANQKAESVTSVGKTSTGYNLLHGNSSMMELDHSPSDLTVVSLRKLPINEPNLRRAWESFIYCTTKDDWFEWMRKLGLEFIRESPSQSIRSCSQLAGTHYPIVRDLFNVAFLSCWNEFSDDIQDELVGALEEAFSSQTVPPEVVQTLLNLAEFLEHDERPLPIDITTLGRYAIKCHAYAKALYYKEMEFQSNPSASLVESLISLNSQIQLPDAASGILSFAQKRHGIVLKESWYEKLQRWDQALAEYEKKLAENPEEMEALLGVCRCRQALGDWGNLNEMSTQIWKDASEDIKNTVAPWAASSAWSLAKWDQMKVFTEKIDPNTVDGSFFRAILAVKDNDIKQFEHCITSTREFLDTELIAMISESYNRAYRTIVRVQMLSELEEVLEYKKSEKIPERREVIKKTWFKRLLDCQESVDVWQNMLKVRSLVLHPNEEEMVWIKFASLCRRMQRPLLSKHVLLGLLNVNESEVEQLVHF